MQRRDLAFGKGEQRNAEMLQPLVESRGVLLIARETVERDGHRDIERRLGRARRDERFRNPVPFRRRGLFQTFVRGGSGSGRSARPERDSIRSS
jgi:hypothetical protein